jgi:hypothetical protein
MSVGTVLLPQSAAVSAQRLIESVLATLTAEKTKEAYRTALQEFLAWMAERGLDGRARRTAVQTCTGNLA